MRTSKKTGFTLIELLVVIAIIAILAAILFPVFARARENARRSSCQSNLKQLGLGIIQYTQDYDEKYPGIDFNYQIGGITATWDMVIQPYTKSSQILVCPSDSFVRYGGGNLTLDMSSVPGYGANAHRSYGIPRNFVENRTANPRQGGRNIAAIPNSAATVMLAEGGGSYGGGDSWVYFDDVSSTCNLLPGDSTLDWHHLGTSNFLFADGHVKALRGGGGGGYANSFLSGYATDSSCGGPNFDDGKQIPQ